MDIPDIAKYVMKTNPQQVADFAIINFLTELLTFEDLNIEYLPNMKSILHNALLIQSFLECKIKSVVDIRNFICKIYHKNCPFKMLQDICIKLKLEIYRTNFKKNKSKYDFLNTNIYKLYIFYIYYTCEYFSQHNPDQQILYIFVLLILNYIIHKLPLLKKIEDVNKISILSNDQSEELFKEVYKSMKMLSDIVNQSSDIYTKIYIKFLQSWVLKLRYHYDIDKLLKLIFNFKEFIAQEVQIDTCDIHCGSIFFITLPHILKFVESVITIPNKCEIYLLYLASYSCKYIPILLKQVFIHDINYIKDIINTYEYEKELLLDNLDLYIYHIISHVKQYDQKINLDKIINFKDILNLYKKIPNKMEKFASCHNEQIENSFNKITKNDNKKHIQYIKTLFYLSKDSTN